MSIFFSRYWFLLALLGLLLLAIPGFALFGLNLFGWETAVNSYMEDHYKFSYHLPLPSWAGLALLIIPLGLLILYFLKLKRKPLSVPSTFLWKKSVEDLHVNSLLQWLRQNVLLLLQLLVFLGLLYSLMGFRFHGRTTEGKRYIIMVDNSASMSAHDVSPSRLEWAKEEARQSIDSYTDTDVGMVVVFNSAAEIMQSFTTNRGLLRQAVRDIAPTERPTRIEEALSLADSLANPVRSTEDAATQPENVQPGKERTYVAPQGVLTDLHLFSDGRFPDLTEAALANLNSRQAGNESALGNLKPRFHLAGKPGSANVNNVGLVTLNALRDERDPTKLIILCRVMNFRPDEVRTKVRLEVLVNGVPKNIYDMPLTLPGRKVIDETVQNQDPSAPRDVPGEGAVSFEIPEADNRSESVLHAKLMNHTDDFPLDDEAWLVVGVPRKARVLIVGDNNDVLQKFFGAEEVLEVANVSYLSPADLTKETYRKPALSGVYDLVIFDRCAPASEQDMPASNTFFVGYPPPPWKRNLLETMANPSITGWVTNSPVLRDLKALYNLEVDQAFKMTALPPRTPLLMEGRKIEKNRNTDIPLLVTLNRQSYTDLILTFPILNDKGEWNTTWPLQASFPLFLRNVLYSLGNLTEAASDDNVQPGQVKTLRPDRTVKQLEVTGPDGKRTPLSHGERGGQTDFTFGATDKVGIYHYNWEGGTPRGFAVNLLDAEESNIEPRSAFSIGSDEIRAGEEHGPPRDLWKWFAVLALLFLLVEWYIYNRRVYI